MKTNPIFQPMKRHRSRLAYMPNLLETKCLRQLDIEENWTRILGRERPDPFQVQSWKPFGKIFSFNFVVFLIATTLTYLFIELASGGPSSVATDAIPGGLVVLSITGLMAAYITNLYRSSWNKRARYYASEEEFYAREIESAD